ncbi:MAG: AAA family ATPase [Nanobdellota archaeon]
MIIGITGGKGGTGKSTLSTSLAKRLAKTKKVLLVDADVDCPNDHLLLNIEREKKDTVKQRVPKINFDKCSKCGECSRVCKSNAIIGKKGKNPLVILDQCIGCGCCHIVCKENAISWDYKKIGSIYLGNKENLDLLSGELKTNQPISEFIVSHLNQWIEKIKNKYDDIIIDTAAGTHCPVISALEKCEKIISVSEPTPLGKHDLKAILNLLDKLGKKTDIVLNKSNLGDKTIIREIAKERKSEIICEIPFSKDIARSYAEGNPSENQEIINIVKRLKQI